MQIAQDHLIQYTWNKTSGRKQLLLKALWNSNQSMCKHSRV